MSSDGANSNVHSLADLAPRSDPVPDLVRNNLDDGHPRIVLVALVYAVPEVAKPRRRAENPRPVRCISEGPCRARNTYAELQCFSIFVLSCVIFAMPEYDAQFVVASS